MRKCLSASGLSVSRVADDLGVSRNTVGTWINGRITPPLPMQKLWAVRFADYGVTLRWLQTGEPGPNGSGPGFPGVAGAGFEPATSGL